MTAALWVLYIAVGAVIAVCLPELKGRGQRASGFLLAAVAVLWGPMVIIGSVLYAGWIISGRADQGEPNG
jgi:hypothetical protein